MYPLQIRLVSIVLILLYLSPACRSSPIEEKLAADLFANYSTVGRPVRTNDDSVKVELHVIISKIIDVNEQKELLTASLEIYILWTDYRLKWNSSNYENLTRLQVLASQLWLPTIILVNNARDTGGYLGYNGEFAGSLVKVKNDGKCNWFVKTVSTTHCPVNVRYFPFDKQNCSIIFEVFQPRREVNMIDHKPNKTKTQSPIEDYTEDGEWHLVGSDVTSNATSRYCRVTKYVFLSRKPFYYVINFVVPCFAFSIISMVTFLIRPDSDQRATVSISLLLGIIVYHLIMNEKLPETSDNVPLLGVYIEFIMMTFIISSIMFIIVSYMYHNEPRVPIWVRRFLCVYIVRLTMVERPVYSDSETSRTNGTRSGANRAKNVHVDTSSNKHNGFSSELRLHTTNDVSSPIMRRVKRNNSTVSDSAVFPARTRDEVLEKILLVLQRIDSKFDMKLKQTPATRRGDDDLEQTANSPSPEWLLATGAVDRLFFYLICTCCVVSNMYLFVSWLVTLFN